MKVLVVGGGGREHALVWKFRQDDARVELIAAPGNAGIATVARCLPIAATDIDGLRALAEGENVDLTVVGPEAPLALGIVDHFRSHRLRIFGPPRAAAAIESSKTFAKELMRHAGVPTAAAERHTDPREAKRAARRFGSPVVIKASGLAAGKGVVVAETLADADDAIEAMLTRHTFGDAGAEILVEEYMRGEELSLLFLTNGTQWRPFAPAQDHKRLLDGDQGPNTGGMGAYAPVFPSVGAGGRDALVGAPADRRSGVAAEGAELITTVADRIVEPILAALRERGSPFTGVLYAGLMLTEQGPRVVEFNCRMGDPETQAVLPLMTDALLPLMAAVAAGESLAEAREQPADRYAVATVVAAAGYPGHPRSGDVVHLPHMEPGVHLFHAGTARNAAGELVTAGGRVLTVTGVASDLARAAHISRDAAAGVDFPGKHYRTDIAWRELTRHARAS